MATTPKRRLPVLKSEPAEGEGEARPPWQWVAFGAGMILAAWLPLAYVGGAIVARMAAPGVVALEVAAVVPLAIAAVAGGFLVGRFGGPAASGPVGVREGALAGAVTGGVAIALTASSSGLSPVLLAVVGLAALFAAAGAAIGVKRRKP